MINRDAAARQESPLLVGAAIDCVFDQVFADAAIMQERGAFPRRSVTRNFLALPGSLEQKIYQLKFCVSYLSCETLVALDPIEFRIAFIGNNFLHARPCGVSLAIGATRINTQRT